MNATETLHERGQSLENRSASDAAVRKNVKEFFELALEDLTRAADLFRPIWERVAGVGQSLAAASDILYIGALAAIEAPWPRRSP